MSLNCSAAEATEGATADVSIIAAASIVSMLRCILLANPVRFTTSPTSIFICGNNNGMHNCVDAPHTAAPQ